MQTLILLFEKRAQLRISDEDFREIFAGLIVDLLRILQTSYKHGKLPTWAHSPFHYAVADR